MDILKKNKKENTQLNSKEVQQNNKCNEGYTPKSMTYMDILYKEYNEKMDELRGKGKRIEKAIRDALEELREIGSGNNGLAEIIADLRKKEEAVQEEINKLFINYPIDLSLSIIANQIDKAEANNRGVDLLYEVARKVNEIVHMLPEIEKCYGNEYYSPTAYAITKHTMHNLVTSLNNELPKVLKVDKKELIKEFNERKEIVEREKTSKLGTKEKYYIE